MLELEDVHTYYGTSHILQGVSFRVPEGKSTVLLGRNGAGKTTTIHTICGLLRCRQGRIRFLDTDIQNLPAHRISQLGMGLVPQGRRIFPSLTIRENLTMSARPNPFTGTKDWDLERVYELFPILKEREKNQGTQLSGGQQQMLAIARALMTNPHLLLMDEPSEGLAPVVIDQIGDILEHLKQTGLAILVVEQNLDLALRTADEIMIMNKGNIVWQGTPEQLATSDDVRHKYLGV
ncbi:ABC transporter ATP-binding protein [Kyrpidia sp.]|uniref:ABC transporter ATP-binding protein n=1 Tax=Kyrpidia sp. TaxID=2073077 RepID=UPI00258B7A2F|nr:ABC transporter ATP-binding protein [Kyrpidia sp.]MCL6575451.1 ABC transporter ATP-binding protein [Kyrpidia sp.]